MKWDDPEMFRPERFIDSDGKFNSVEELYFFGFGKWFKLQYKNIHNDDVFLIILFLGKRRCPGEVLAQRFITLVFANLIHDFTIEIDQLPDGVNCGILLTPKPYKIKLSKRK